MILKKHFLNNPNLCLYTNANINTLIKMFCMWCVLKSRHAKQPFVCIAHAHAFFLSSRCRRRRPVHKNSNVPNISAGDTFATHRHKGDDNNIIKRVQWSCGGEFKNYMQPRTTRARDKNKLYISRMNYCLIIVNCMDIVFKITLW